MAEKPATLGELKASGYRPQPVKAEIRCNLISRLRSGDPLFPGIKGYDDSVIPQIVNALLSGQDIIFLGERGQAKSRLVRGLANLLDEWIPVLDGAEIPGKSLSAGQPPGPRPRGRAWRQRTDTLAGPR